MKSIRKTQKLFFILLFLFALSFSSGCEQRVKYEQNKKLLKPALNVQTIKATTKNGNIEYNGNDNSDYQVVAKITAKAKTSETAQRLAENTKVFLEEANNEIKIKIQKPDTLEPESISVDLNISGPKETALIFKSKNGDITINQTNRNMTVTTKNGDIKAYDIGSNASVESKNGDIEMDGLKGNSQVINKNGDIDLVYEPQAKASEISIVNKNGDIKLKPPRWDSVHIQIDNKNGSDVNCQFPMSFRNKMKGFADWKIGDGKNKLKITTTNGDIKIY